MPRTALLPLWIALLGPAIACAQQPGAAGDRLFCSASEEMLWLVVGRQDEQSKDVLSTMSFMDRISPQIRSLAIPPQRGTIAMCAAIGESLHVFYDNGVHYRYAPHHSRREVRLPYESLPLAIAGEMVDRIPVLWAVVDDRAAAQIAERWERHLHEQSTQPADRGPQVVPGTLSIGTRPATSYHLVSYQGEFWRPGPALPASFGESSQVWLSVAQGRHHVFWQLNASEPEIQYAALDRDRWTQGPAIRLAQPPRRALAGVVNSQLKFTALHPDASGALRNESWILQEAAPGKAARWNRLPGPKEPSGEELRLSPGSAVGMFLDNAVFLRPGEKQAEMGLWRMMTGEQDQAFREVPQRSTESEGRRSIRELTATFAVAVMLVLVFWRRQESLARPVTLPPGITTVRPAKRAAAAILDALPAGIVVSMIWRQEITAFAAEMQAMTSDAQAVASWPVQLLIAWIAFSALYAAYCAAFEIGMGRTPGKMLFGFEVVSERFERPSAVQVIIRNAARILELEPHLLIWPFLLVIFLTPHRQRIGDLLARTMVVERAKLYRSLHEDDTQESGEA